MSAQSPSISNVALCADTDIDSPLFGSSHPIDRQACGVSVFASCIMTTSLGCAPIVEGCGAALAGSYERQQQQEFVDHY